MGKWRISKADREAPLLPGLEGSESLLPPLPHAAWKLLLVWNVGGGIRDQGGRGQYHREDERGRWEPSWQYSIWEKPQ